MTGEVSKGKRKVAKVKRVSGHPSWDLLNCSGKSGTGMTLPLGTIVRAFTGHLLMGGSKSYGSTAK